MVKAIKDDWGNVIKDGDVVYFSYGIPPTGVKAPVFERDGVLWIATPDHNPKEAKLSYLRKWFNFYKETPK
jgi:hypothetical protein